MGSEYIYYLAKVGKARKLKKKFHGKTEDEVKALVSAFTDGVTPLVIACIEGHLNVVKYLLEKCDADIKQVSLYHGINANFTIETGKKGSPLFSKAIFRHTDIGEALYNFSGNVENFNDFTPLIAACFEGRFKIAKYLIRHGADIESTDKSGNTCLMYTCSKGYYDIFQYLLECGADVNKKNIKGHTSLHACVKSNNLNMIKILLQYGATIEMNNPSETPLSYAAFNGKASIVEYFISKYNFSNQDKVDAFEILGATFVDKSQYIPAHNYWTQAMKLRFEDRNFPLHKSCYNAPISAYIHATEVNTIVQLNELTKEGMHMQALLINERILGPGNFKTLLQIRARGEFYASKSDFRCIPLWMYLIDIEDTSCRMQIFQYLTRIRFAHLFYRMVETIGAKSVSFCDVLHVFESAVQSINSHLNLPKFQSMLEYDLLLVMHLLNLMCKLKPYLNPKEIMKLNESAYKIVHVNLKDKKCSTPLHFASSKHKKNYLSKDLPMMEFPSPEVVELLLEVGASPNALDSYNNTPLHMFIHTPRSAAVFNLLLNQGGHLDYCNDSNQTPLQIVRNSYLLDINPLQHLNLKCLCAQAIHSNNVLYNGLVPEELCKFINCHGRDIKNLAHPQV